MMNFIQENWLVIATVIIAIYEVVARRIPTTGNWSIVHLAIQVLDIIVENKAKTKELNEVNEPVKKRFKLRKTRK